MTKDPIWEILDHQTRSMKWLAGKIGRSVSYIKQIKYGQAEASPDFRARCATALDLPERLLFLDPHRSFERTDFTEPPERTGTRG